MSSRISSRTIEVNGVPHVAIFLEALNREGSWVPDADANCAVRLDPGEFEADARARAVELFVRHFPAIAQAHDVSSRSNRSNRDHTDN